MIRNPLVSWIDGRSTRRERRLAAPGESTATSHAPARWLLYAVWLCVALGTVVRLRLYLARRALWFDEAAVALNVVDRSFLELLAPLDFRQTAPPLFLWLERTAVLLGGPNELALRAPALVAGLLLAPLTWWVGQRLTSESAAAIATALVAFSPPLVYYSNELKPYAVDALVTLLLLAGAFHVTGAPTSGRRWTALAAGGAAALFASTPSVFVLAGVAAFLLLDSHTRRAAGFPAHALATVGAWGVAFAATVILHREVADPAAPLGHFLRASWSPYFLTTSPPGLYERGVRAAHEAIRLTLFDGRSRPYELPALAAALVAGIAVVARTRGLASAALLATPLLALVVAGALQQYPLRSRILLFAAPLIAFCLASAGAALAKTLPRRAAPVGLLVVGLLLLWRPLSKAATTAWSPPGRYEAREMVRALTPIAAARREPIWLSGGAENAWRFYSGLPGPRPYARTDDFPDPHARPMPPGVLLGRWFTDSASAARSGWADIEAARIAGAAHPCALLLFSLAKGAERRELSRALARRGARISTLHIRPGARLYRACFPDGDA